jgi:hypothetical protein
VETVRIERAARRLSDSFPELKCKVDRTGFFARGAIYYEIFRRQADVGQPPTPFSHPIRWQFSTTRLPGLTRMQRLQEGLLQFGGGAGSRRMQRCRQIRVTRYGTMWARNTKNIQRIPGSSEGGSGVYVLFDGSMLVYVGKGKIRQCIRGHRRSKSRGQMWDRFSWYVVANQSGPGH